MASLMTDAEETQPTAKVAKGGPSRRSSSRFGTRLIQGQGLVLMLAALVVYFAATTPFFLTAGNLLGVGTTASALGIMAIAQTFLILSGGVDLSVGSAVALSGVTISLLYSDGVSIWAAALVGILVGVGVGVVNGVLAVVLKINALIVSLGTLSVFVGLAYLLAGGRTIVVADRSFDFIGSGHIGPIPFPLLVFAFLVAMAYFVQRYTILGRQIYAIGGNPEAARLSGLNVDRTRFALYVASGLSAGLAGVMITSQLNAASAEVGTSFLLSVVTAVILGGTSLEGGSGGIPGTVIAVFILGILQNGFALLGFPSSIQTMALGAALILAVSLDQISRRAKR